MRFGDASLFSREPPLFKIHRSVCYLLVTSPTPRAIANVRIERRAGESAVFTVSMSPSKDEERGHGRFPQGRPSSGNGEEEDVATGTGASTPIKHQEQEFSPFDHDSKTAYYNQASEKSISHAEAKMIYRRHVLESSLHDNEQTNPNTRPRISPSDVDGGIGASDLRRTVSRASRKCMPYVEHSHRRSETSFIIIPMSLPAWLHSSQCR